MLVKFNKTDADVGKLIVGNTYRLEIIQNDVKIDIKKALIERVNIETNEVEFTPLVENESENIIQFITEDNISNV